MSEADIFAAELKAATQKMEVKLSQLSSASLKEVLRRVKDRTPVDTGELKESWKIEGGENLSDAVLVSDKEYASFVEEGTPTTQPVGMVDLTFAEMQSEDIDDGSVIE